MTAQQIAVESALPQMKGMSAEQRQKVMRDPATRQILMKAISDAGNPAYTNTIRDQIAERLRNDPQTADFQITKNSFEFVSVDSRRLVERMEKLGTLDPHTHSPVVEESATKFTDAFMGKYFSEAPRDIYSSARSLVEGQRREAEIYDFKCTRDAPKLEYRNADMIHIGDLPVMSPIPCDEVLHRKQPSAVAVP